MLPVVDGFEVLPAGAREPGLEGHPHRAADRPGQRGQRDQRPGPRGRRLRHQALLERGSRGQGQRAAGMSTADEAAAPSGWFVLACILFFIGVVGGLGRPVLAGPQLSTDEREFMHELDPGRTASTSSARRSSSVAGVGLGDRVGVTGCTSCRSARIAEETGIMHGVNPGHRIRRRRAAADVVRLAGCHQRGRRPPSRRCTAPWRSASPKRAPASRKRRISCPWCWPNCPRGSWSAARKDASSSTTSAPGSCWSPRTSRRLGRQTAPRPTGSSGWAARFSASIDKPLITCALDDIAAQLRRGGHDLHLVLRDRRRGAGACCRWRRFRSSARCGR
ncbi:MAG: hypothetical protein MZV70_64495 [Desulfobacterales bacterium]|nr:hypothetical protein [Desulfobacterales bacterium]